MTLQRASDLTWPVEFFRLYEFQILWYLDKLLLQKTNSRDRPWMETWGPKLSIPQHLFLYWGTLHDSSIFCTHTDTIREVQRFILFGFVHNAWPFTVRVPCFRRQSILNNWFNADQLDNKNRNKRISILLFSNQIPIKGSELMLGNRNVP